MKIKLNYNEKVFEFSIWEDNVLITIPFIVILKTGRKLMYYSDANSSTPVKDWYDKLDEDLKLLVVMKKK